MYLKYLSLKNFIILENINLYGKQFFLVNILNLESCKKLKDIINLFANI